MCDSRDAAGALDSAVPATLLMLIMLLAPLALLARFSLNLFDPIQIMLAAITSANYARSSRRTWRAT